MNRRGQRARAIVITRRGYAILRAVERGTYKFMTPKNRKRKANGQYA